MIFSEYEDIVSVDDVMKMLHIGRSNVYKLLREKEIKSIRIGVKYIIVPSPKKQTKNTREKLNEKNDKYDIKLLYSTAFIPRFA